jgi:cystathionine beta-lyase
MLERAAHDFGRTARSVVPWTEPGPLLRIHAGLESADDLIRDLHRALDRLTQLA